MTRTELIGLMEQHRSFFSPDVPLPCLNPAEEALNKKELTALAESASPPAEALLELAEAYRKRLTEEAAGVLQGDFPREEVIEALNSYAALSFPSERLMSSPVALDLKVDTGDSCCDYTANTLAPGCCVIYTENSFHIPPNASIGWLTRQQGYSRARLTDCLYRVEKEKLAVSDSPFLAHAAYEVWHALSSLNPLCFFFRLTLRDYLLLLTQVLWAGSSGKWPGYVMIGRDTRCGFYDDFQGSGSLLGLFLERDVKLPVKYIASVTPEAAEHYSPLSIWGDKKLWDGTGITAIHMPKRFRKELASLGFPALSEDPRESTYRPAKVSPPDGT